MGQKVSVIMPAFNAELFIKPAIESVLSQSYKEIELVLIDDGSTDDTAKIAKSYSAKDKRVKLLKNHTNLGIVKSLNRAIVNADGDYIARADSDDICSPDRIAKQAKLLKDNPNIAIVGSDLEIINEEGESIGFRRYPTDPASIKRVLFYKNPFAHPSVMIRASCLDESPYRGTFPHAEDYYLWARLLEKHDGCNIPEFLVKYRISGQQIKARKLKEQLRSTILVQKLIFNRFPQVPLGARWGNLLLKLVYFLPSPWIFKFFVRKEFKTRTT